MAETEGKKIAVFNRGQRTYTTSIGALMPKHSLTLPEKEAKDLMDYHDIIELEKVAPKTTEKLKSLEKENAELKEKLSASEGKKDDADSEESDHKDSGKGGKKGRK